jgi:hypothetical protein
MVQWQKISGIPLDYTIRGAIDRAALDAGNAAEFARRIGVSVGIMSQWRARNAARPVKVIPFPKWEKLYPHIRDYLPADDPRYLPRALSYSDFKPPDIEGREPPAPYLAYPEADELARHLPPELLAEIKAELSKLYHEKITLAAARLFLESRRAQ